MWTCVLSELYALEQLRSEIATACDRYRPKTWCCEIKLKCDLQGTGQLYYPHFYEILEEWKIFILGKTAVIFTFVKII